jgi:hypothetical protein
MCSYPPSVSTACCCSCVSSLYAADVADSQRNQRINNHADSLVLRVLLCLSAERKLACTSPMSFRLRCPLPASSKMMRLLFPPSSMVAGRRLAMAACRTGSSVTVISSDYTQPHVIPGGSLSLHTCSGGRHQQCISSNGQQGPICMPCMTTPQMRLPEWSSHYLLSGAFKVMYCNAYQPAPDLCTRLCSVLAVCAWQRLQPRTCATRCPVAVLPVNATLARAGCELQQQQMQSTKSVNTHIQVVAADKNSSYHLCCAADTAAISCKMHSVL